MFHAESAGLLSKSAVCAPWMYASLVVVGLEGRHGKPTLLMGPMPALCARCAETPPNTIVLSAFTFCVVHAPSSERGSIGHFTCTSTPPPAVLSNPPILFEW